MCEGEGREQWRIQAFADGGANRELGLSVLCLGISYCGKPICVRPHRFTRHGIIKEKTFSVMKGKVWLPQAKFFPRCDRSQNGDRIKQNADQLHCDMYQLY